MDFYSIGCIDISVERQAGKGGYRIGDEEHYRVRNCEWVAEFRLRRGWRAPRTPTIELAATFAHGNRLKFDADFHRILPLAEVMFGANGAEVRL